MSLEHRFAQRGNWFSSAQAWLGGIIRPSTVSLVLALTVFAELQPDVQGAEKAADSRSKIDFNRDVRPILCSTGRSGATTSTPPRPTDCSQ